MRFSRMVNVVKCHVGGEVNNVVTGGIGDVGGSVRDEVLPRPR